MPRPCSCGRTDPATLSYGLCMACGREAVRARDHGQPGHECAESSCDIRIALKERR